MNLKTLGLIPKSLRISGSWSQCATKKACRLSMNRLVAQAFQPAGLPDFRVRWTRNGQVARTRRLESLRYEPALVHGPNARQKGVQALHEPEDTWLDSEELTYFRFLVPMRDKKGVQALSLHEPKWESPTVRRFW